MSIINIYGIEHESIVDGPGMRYALFVQGCSHGCPGCHNPDSQLHINNKLMSVDELERDILSQKLSKDVTFSGGEPFEQIDALAELASRLKERGRNIWCWTGYLYENLYKSKKAQKLLQYIDVLVDGPFVEAKKSMTCTWRGSTNQRLIDVQKSSPDNIVLWEQPDPLAQFTVPESW